MVVISLKKCKYEEKQSRKRSVKELIIMFITNVYYIMHIIIIDYMHLILSVIQSHIHTHERMKLGDGKQNWRPFNP